MGSLWNSRMSLISSSMSQIDNPITFHPSGKFADVLNTISDANGNPSTTLDLYSVDSVTGGLTLVKTGVLTFANSQSQPSFISVPLFHPSGRFLYAVGCTSSSGSSCSFAEFTVDSATGTLISVPGFDVAPSIVSGPVFDKSGQHAYLLSGTSGNIIVFSVDTVTGNWSQIATIPDGGSRIAITH